MALFKGFSTIGTGTRWKLEDIELIKRDILNHFQTRRGERLMNPKFGSRIWEFAFEPMGDNLRDAILDDATRIIAAEPRVVANKISVRTFEHGFQIDIELHFVAQDISAPMFVQFNQKQQILTSF